MTFSQLALDIWTNDLESPTTPTITAIEAWLRTHVGDLNNLLALDLEIGEDTELTTDLSEEESSIFKMTYLSDYYRRQITSNLGAAAYDWSELTEGDQTVRRVSKNEVAKTLRLVKNDLDARLEKAAFKYRFDKSIPRSLEAVNDLYQFDRNDSTGTT